MNARSTVVRVVVGVVLAAIAIGLPYQNPPDQNLIFSQVLYLAVAAMGLNLLTGFNGQVSIGHGAFFGVGAFTTAILVKDHGWMIEATIPVAAAIGAALGVVVGFPALRVKGLYLALVTLAMAVIFPDIANRFLDGSQRVSRGSTESMIDSVPNDIYRYYVLLGVTALMFLLAWNLTRGRFGRAMIAVRDQEVAASTVGVDVARVKVTSFALSAAYASVAGAMSIMVDRTASASNPLFYFQRSIEFLIAVVIGGAATIAGPLLGAILLTVLQRNAQGTESLAPALLGGLLILAVYVLLDGVVGGLRRLWAKVRPRAAAPPTPDLTTPPSGDPAPS